MREFSQQLQPDDSTVKHENFCFHPTDIRYSRNRFKAAARKKVVRFQSEWKDRRNKSSPNQCIDTWIAPLIQMYPFKIRQDEIVTSDLLRSAQKECKWKLASGYFNLTKDFMDIILQFQSQFDILMAHPTVNGFYCTKGVAGRGRKYICSGKTVWVLTLRSKSISDLNYFVTKLLNAINQSVNQSINESVNLGGTAMCYIDF